MAPATEPRVRASHLKEDLEAFRVLGAAGEAGARARLRPETTRAIEEAARVEFLPVAVKAELAEAVFAEAGEPGARRWAREALLLSLQGLYRPLVAAILAVADPTPTTILRLSFPRGWQASYRDCGEFAVEEPAPGQTRLVLRGVPPALRIRSYLAALCGTLEAIWEVSSYTGEVELERWGPAVEEAAWLMGWRRKERPAAPGPGSPGRSSP
jgi:hypothetical protein